MDYRIPFAKILQAKMSKKTAELIIRHLLGIVAALQKEYAIESGHNICIAPEDSVTKIPLYDKIEETKTPATGNGWPYCILEKTKGRKCGKMTTTK